MLPCGSTSITRLLNWSAMRTLPLLLKRLCAAPAARAEMDDAARLARRIAVPIIAMRGADLEGGGASGDPVRDVALQLVGKMRMIAASGSERLDCRQGFTIATRCRRRAGAR